MTTGEWLQNALAHESREMVGESAGNWTAMHEQAALEVVFDSATSQVG